MCSQLEAFKQQTHCKYSSVPATHEAYHNFWFGIRESFPGEWEIWYYSLFLLSFRFISAFCFLSLFFRPTIVCGLSICFQLRTSCTLARNCHRPGLCFHLSAYAVAVSLHRSVHSIGIGPSEINTFSAFRRLLYTFFGARMLLISILGSIGSVCWLHAFPFRWSPKRVKINRID